VDGPELRSDAFTGERVVIAGHRQARPDRAAAGSAGCPFCAGGLEAPDPYEVRSFANRWPALGPGIGACEVVLYSPDHGASLASLGDDHARKVVDLWADRTVALLAQPDIEYVLVFENRGAEVGATVDHPHGQIYAYNFTPPVAAREAEEAHRAGCPSCRAWRDEPAAGRAVRVDDAGGWLTWVPAASAWPYGVVVAPRRHAPALCDLDGNERDGLARALVDMVARYDALHDEPFPFMMWIHPGVHVHLHFAPPRRAPGLTRFIAAGELGSGVMTNPIAPERAAADLRAALS